MIAIVDYKAGNITSVKKALDALGVDSVVTSDPKMIAGADKLMLPGVGHFAATEMLDGSGMKAAIQNAIERGVPFLGICVGMQWMFEGSTEAPGIRGLGAFLGQCSRFAEGGGLKVPHVGWNSLEVEAASRLMCGVNGFVYYSHSYRAPVIDETVAQTEYGGRFSAAVERRNIFGVQFHPEKSGELGLRVLRNFVEL